MSDRDFYAAEKAVESAVQNDPELLERIRRDHEQRQKGNGADVRAEDPAGDIPLIEHSPDPERTGPGAFPKAAWRGLFAEYRDEMRRCSEAPDAYNFLALWAAAGNALGRRVWFPYSMRLYGNIYGVAFGP